MTQKAKESRLVLPMPPLQAAYLPAMMSPVSESPFAVLTLIAAPAVFTNASSVLSLGTGNRLARVVDRTRMLVKDLHGAEINAVTRSLWISHLGQLERRAALLVRAMSFFYGAIGCFASASVVSILGASVVSNNFKWAFQAIVIVSFVLGTVGFTGLAVGCSMLVNETRLAVRCMNEEAQMAKSWYK